MTPEARHFGLAELLALPGTEHVRETLGAAATDYLADRDTTVAVTRLARAENTYRRIDARERVARHCRQCNVVRSARWRRRQKSAVLS